jgi:Ca2+-binding EF-hand superfamily protein
MRPRSVAIIFAVALAALGSAAHARDQQKPDAQAAFAEADKNGDGEIDLCEFHTRIVEVFYNADSNKDGFLSADEYQHLPLSNDFKDADPNGDARISLHEFVAIRYRQLVDADSNHDGALSLAEVTAAYEGRKTP